METRIQENFEYSYNWRKNPQNTIQTACLFKKFEARKERIKKIDFIELIFHFEITQFFYIFMNK